MPRNLPSHSPRMLLTLPSLAAAALLLTAAGAWATAPFYLSADRAFLPGEEAAVQLQAGGPREVRFVLYRVEDPAAFFLELDDVHRPEVEGTPLRGALDQAIARSVGLEKPPLQSSPAAGGDESPSTIPVTYLRTWVEKVPGPAGWSARRVPIGVSEPGLYLVEAVDGGRVAYATVGVTSLAVVTKRAPGRLLAWAVDRKTGAPLPGTTIQVVRGRRAVEVGSTGADGLFQAKAPPDPGLVILAVRGPDWSVDDPVYVPAGAPHLKVYLTTDRPVYRPGDSVRLKGMLRAWSPSGYELPDVGDVELAATDARGNALFSGKAPVNTWGGFSAGFPLPPTSALGTARLVALVAGKGYAAEFSVEEFRRPELEVAVRPDRPFCLGGQKAVFRVEAGYYAGGPVARGRARCTLRRTAFATPPPLGASDDAPWFQTRAQAQASLPETLESKELTLDDAGRATYEAPTARLDGERVYTLSVEVADPGRATGEGSGSLRACPAAFRLEVTTDKFLYPAEDNARVTVRALDPLDRPVQTPVTVVLQERNGPAGGAEAARPREFAGATGTDGSWSFECPLPTRGLFAFAAAARDTEDNAVAAERLVWVADGDVPLAYRGDWITLLPDRASYRPGETARVLALFPFAAPQPLVTVEGDRLLSWSVLALAGNARVLEIPIRGEHAPNAFVSVSCVHANEFLSATRSILVPPREKLLQVDVSGPQEVFRPREEAEFAVRVRDAEGRPVAAEVAVGLVDEALYAVSRERAVPMATFFYPLRRNSVGTGSSVYLRSYGQAERTARLHGQPGDAQDDGGGVGQAGSAGPPRRARGSAAEEDDKVGASAPEPASPLAAKDGPAAGPPVAAAALRRDFRATAAWEPSLTTGDDGRATFRVVFPDDLTTWRFTARAATVDTQVGEGTSSVRTTLRVRAQLVAPRFLVERDATTVALTGTNGLDEETAMTLSVAGEGVRVLPPPTVTEEVGRGRSLSKEWRVEAEAAGEARLEATVGSAAESDAVRVTLPIRRHGVTRTAAFAWKVDAAPETFSLELPADADPSSAELTISFAPAVAAAIGAALDYLADYPYGCTEQTLSRFIPDLAAAGALTQLGLRHPRLERELPAMVAKGFERLAALQHPDGGWGWWSRDATDPAMTAYVLRGLLLAREVGAPVGKAMLARGLERLAALVEAQPLDDPTRALALFALARGGIDVRAQLEKLYGARDRLQSGAQACALLALALAASGRQEEARAVAGELEKAARERDDGAYWGETAASQWQSDAVESTAWALSALLALKPQSEAIPKAVEWLLQERTGESWKSTRDTAVATLALVETLRARPETWVEAELAVRVNGTTLNAVALTRERLSGDGLSVRVASHRLRIGPNEIVLTKRRGPSVHYHAVLSWTTGEEGIPPSSSGLEIDRRYFLLIPDPEGKQSRWKAVPLGDNPVPRGSRVLVRLEARTVAARDYLLVEDPLPATARVLTGDAEADVTGVPGAAGPEERQGAVHREIRDDRVAFFFDRVAPGAVSMSYVFEAEHPGRFHALPASAQLLYFPRVRGQSGERVMVVK
ncbi:MAG: hypothetical protein HYZ53_13000 [Planctomycetes bacterium]|nr:hypothetical protein [Planctomycetota bacterium]